MAATRIVIHPTQPYEFDLPADGKQSLILKAPIDSVGCASGVLVVRAYGVEFQSATARLKVVVGNVAVSTDAPFSVRSEVAVAMVEIGPSSPPEGGGGGPSPDNSGMLLCAFVPPIGPQLGVVLELDQGSDPGTCKVWLAVELIGRDM